MLIPAFARNRLLLAAVLATGLATAAVAAHANARSSAPTTRVVTTAKNARLGETVLVTSKGLTLYSLSVERKGKFICTDATCLSLWTPLLVPKGTAPSGVKGLGTIARPGAKSRLQVTFRGAPLYTFNMDEKRGDTKGEGFKDVGVWHAVAAAAMHGAAAAPPPPAGGGGGYGGGYGR